VAEQVIRRTDLLVCGEPRILEIAPDKAPTFQRAANAPGDPLDQFL
jgi:hypothetical protein